MSLVVISHPDCLKHQIDRTHPEKPLRVKKIDETLRQAPFKDKLSFVYAPLATKRQLCQVHDPEHVDYLFDNAPEAGTFEITADTKMNPHTLRAARLAAGATMKAVDLVLSGKYQRAFCNIRPPGHHASRSETAGFCFFNNIALGVDHALKHKDVNRVAVIDFDVHHGDGTDDIFADDERVLFMSCYQNPLFPFEYPEKEKKTTAYSPLKEGDTYSDFEEIFKQKWLTKLKAFKPDLIFISAGFDAHRLDSQAGVSFEEHDYYQMTQSIKEVAESVCGGRVISSLEGGYHINALVRSVVAHQQSLLDLPFDLKFLEKENKQSKPKPESEAAGRPLLFTHSYGLRSKDKQAPAVSESQRLKKRHSPRNLA